MFDLVSFYIFPPPPFFSHCKYIHANSRVSPGSRSWNIKARVSQSSASKYSQIINFRNILTWNLHVSSTWSSHSQLFHDHYTLQSRGLLHSKAHGKCGCGAQSKLHPTPSPTPPLQLPCTKSLILKLMGLFMYNVFLFAWLTFHFFFFFLNQLIYFCPIILLGYMHVSLQCYCLSFPYFIFDQIYQIHLKRLKLVPGLMVWVNDAHITPANKGGLHYTWNT